MLSNVVKNCINPNFWFVFEHTENLIFSTNIFIKVFYKKDVYGKYLSFATLGSHVVCLEAKVFKFP